MYSRKGNATGEMVGESGRASLSSISTEEWPERAVLMVDDVGASTHNPYLRVSSPLTEVVVVMEE